MQSIAIVGVGLIGGSIGMGLRKAGFTGPILGVSSALTIDNAISAGAIDRGVSLAQAAADADVLYLSQPINGILATLEQLSGILPPNRLVTDAGSTKALIVKKALSVLPPLSFLGGHPMAGKELRGVNAAEADLFRGRTYVFTPETGDQIHTPLASAFIEWMRQLGAVPALMSPAEHDRVVALTSHLPQLASTALAAALAGKIEADEQLDVAGSGLRDGTRLALSSYDIWADIVATNTLAIDHALTVYIDKLTEIRDNLQTQRLSEIFFTAAGLASRIRR